MPQARGAAASAGLEDSATIVREIFEHEDGTLIGPPKQTADPEETPEQKRLTLGEILLREAEAMQARKEVVDQARQNAAAEAEQPISIELPSPNSGHCRHRFLKIQTRTL